MLTEKETTIYNFLDLLNIKYEKVSHKEANTMEDFKQIKDKVGIKIHKNLLLMNRQQTDFYLLLIDGEKKFITKDVSKQLGCARLSFALPEHMEKFLNTSPGSLSILGLIFDVNKVIKLVVDCDLLKEEYFGCHPCLNTSTVKFKTDDIFEVFLKKLDYKPVFINI